jgi:hypothetical protein
MGGVTAPKVVEWSKALMPGGPRYTNYFLMTFSAGNFTIIIRYCFGDFYVI